MNKIPRPLTVRSIWRAGNPTEPLPSDDASYCLDWVGVRGSEDVVSQMDNTLWCPSLVHELFDVGLS